LRYYNKLSAENKKTSPEGLVFFYCLAAAETPASLSVTIAAENRAIVGGLEGERSNFHSALGALPVALVHLPLTTTLKIVVVSHFAFFAQINCLGLFDCSLAV